MLLLGSLSSLQVANTITAVKLDIDLVVEVGLAVVKTTSLDDNLARHDVEASVEAGAAVTTEEVVVYLTRGAGDIVLLGRAWKYQCLLGKETWLKVIPLVTEKSSSATTALEVKAPPVHFWQSMQWQRAVIAASSI